MFPLLRRCKSFEHFIIMKRFLPQINHKKNPEKKYLSGCEEDFKVVVSEKGNPNEVNSGTRIFLFLLEDSPDRTSVSIRQNTEIHFSFCHLELGPEGIL